jgi:hypothetical protein
MDLKEQMATRESSGTVSTEQWCKHLASSFRRCLSHSLPMWKPCRRAIYCFCGLDLWNILHRVLSSAKAS